MNKTQFYTLGGALLASTALTGTASAGTIGRYDTTNNFTTSAASIANSIFSTTASTANSVVIGSAAGDNHFGMRYNNNFSGTTHFTTEFTVSGARFITAGLTTANVKLMLTTATNTASVVSTLSGTVACASVTSLVDLFVVNDCWLSTGVGQTGAVHGLTFTGVTFNNASGLATAGAGITLTGRVYNPTNTSQIFEASSSGTIITAAAPFQVAVAAGVDATASATTTPIAFTSLSAPTNGSLSLNLVTVRISSTGALGNGLAAASAIATTAAGTTSVAVSSSILSGAAITSVSLLQNAVVDFGPITTAANFTSGTVTFSLDNATTWSQGASIVVAVQFSGTASIPAAVAGSVTASISGGEQSQTTTGATAAITQGGFRAEVNTFNASTNGPFGSYLRVHNNGQVAGTVTITVRNDATGAVVGSSYTTASIAPNSTVQFTALQIETGASVPTESRTGSYTLSVTGPMIGYVQHILFDGNSVADLSGYRNSGVTTNQP